MALLAYRHGLDMIRRHGFTRHPAAHTVAGAALRGRTFEDALQMAAGTIRIRMRAIQRETGRKVVKNTGRLFYGCSHSRRVNSRRL